MKLLTKRLNKYLLLKPDVERLDAASAPKFKEKATNIIDLGQYDLLIDFANIEYIDSIGLASIVSLLKHIQNRGEIILCGLRKSVIIYFEITKMDRVFRIYENHKEVLLKNINLS